MNYEKYRIKAQAVNNSLLLLPDIQNADSKVAYSIHSRGKEDALCENRRDMPGIDSSPTTLACVSVNFIPLPNIQYCN